MEYRIENTFEVPSQEEWNKYLGSIIFNGMTIDAEKFNVGQDPLSQLVFSEHIRNYIRQHNNKVGTLKVSYVFCRHYFDKGIPDDNWYSFPGKNGETIQYMPDFESKDWVVRYWFSFFSEVVYFKLFSIWDSFVGFINEYYQLNQKENYKFRQNILDSLKSKRSDIAYFMEKIIEEQIYKEANNFRNKIVHGFTPNDVTSGIRILRNIETEIYDLNEDRTIKSNKKGELIKKKIKTIYNISLGIGEYTTSRKIMENIDEFSKFTGSRISKIIDMMIKDPFSIT